MKAVIVGLGSMGRRRLRLLRENFADVIVYGVDKNKERCDLVKTEFNIDIYASVEEVFSKQKIDCAFICSSPLSHAMITAVCLENGSNIFTEINLVSDGYIENIEQAKKSDRILFLSSTFLYRSENNLIITKIHKSNKRLFYTYHVGQYLPDWHPWEKINSFFVSDKKTNACRELFAIELPWLIKAFGKIKNVDVHKDTFSNLNLKYPDIYFVTFEHERGHRGQICIDVVSRIPIRHFEAFSEDLQIEWRGTPEKLWVADGDLKNMQAIEDIETTKRVNGYREFIVENAYLEEIKEFFAVCKGKPNNKYTFTDDLYTLSIIDAIEK